MIVVKEISAAATYAIRLKVLRANIDLPFKFINDLDADTFHLGIYFKTKLVGVATFVKSKSDFLIGTQYQLRGMAVLEEARGKGFGKEIIEEANAILRSKQVDFLWCNAREESVLFYEKLNFAKKGAAFRIPKIGVHYKMYLKI